MGQICCTILFLLSLKQKPKKIQPLHPTLLELCQKKQKKKSDEYVMNLLEKKPTSNYKILEPKLC